MPPFANSVHDVSESAGASSKTRRGAALSAAHRPAAPAPMITTSASQHSMSHSQSMLNCQHAIKRAPCPPRDPGFDLNCIAQILQNPSNAQWRDGLHVTAQIAGSQELDLRMFERDVVSHQI